MAIIDSKYLGSFQKGLRITAENPLEEVWSRLGLYGSEDYLGERLTDVKDKQVSADYIAVRMRQAIELRAATRQATLLTAPLTLYYSVLNLTRASMAIRDDILDSKRHGLIFKEAPQILASHAEVTDGTFSQYISVAGSTAKKGVQISLNDCLSRVIETSADYYEVAGDRPHACPVTVEAYRRGKTFLKFQSIWAGGEQHFRSHWETEYPSLVAFCELAPPGDCSLRIKTDKEPNSLDGVSSLCYQVLEVNLIPTSDPTWFIVRRTDTNPLWPRAAYYFAALFILGNIVRYQPESIAQIASTNSKWSWFLRRFVAAADRFYSNLMLNWIHNAVHLFGSG